MILIDTYTILLYSPPEFQSDMTVGDLVLSRFEARIRFTSDATMPRWAGNALRSGFGARLRDLVCVDGGASFDDNCAGCPHRENCVYDRFYNARPPENAQVLRKQAAISRPFVLDPPASGEYRTGEGAILGFTLPYSAAASSTYLTLSWR